jgi:hypothetical protein
LLAIGLIAGLVAGCSGGGGDPSPSPTPPVASTPGTSAVPSSPSASRTGPLTTGPNVRPGEKPPVIPAQARERTENGALQLAGFYYKALDWTIATNDDYLIRQIATTSCRACRLVHNALLRLKAAHEVQHGGRIQVKAVRLETSRFALKYDYAFEITYSQDAVVVESPDGVSRTTSPGVTRSSSLVFVAWSGGRWRVVNVTAK